MLKDPMDTLAPHVRKEIELLWERHVRGGGQRYRTSNDRSGLEGQQDISALLKEQKIEPDWDGKYEAIIEYGRSLYHGKRPPGPITGKKIKRKWQVGAVSDEETDYSEG